MANSIRMLNLLDQLKVQVLLYSGTLIDHQASGGNCLPLLNTAVALKHKRVDKLLLTVEQEAKHCSCAYNLTALIAPVHKRTEL